MARAVSTMLDESGMFDWSIDEVAPEAPPAGTTMNPATTNATAALISPFLRENIKFHPHYGIASSPTGSVHRSGDSQCGITLYSCQIYVKDSHRIVEDLSNNYWQAW